MNDISSRNHSHDHLLCRRRRSPPPSFASIREEPLLQLLCMMFEDRPRRLRRLSNVLARHPSKLTILVPTLGKLLVRHDDDLLLLLLVVVVAFRPFGDAASSSP